MGLWNLNFRYDFEVERDPGGEPHKLDSVLANSAQDAIRKTFTSLDWNVVNITDVLDDEGFETYPVFEYRLKDAHFSVFVWEQLGVCPECGSEDPFEPKKDRCPTCRSEAYEQVQDLEIRAGWDPTP